MRTTCALSYQDLGHYTTFRGYHDLFAAFGLSLLSFCGMVTSFLFVVLCVQSVVYGLFRRSSSSRSFFFRKRGLVTVKMLLCETVTMLFGFLLGREEEDGKMGVSLDVLL